jgi:NitT/TauT family transport system substrate-binding protein
MMPSEVVKMLRGPSRLALAAILSIGALAAYAAQKPIVVAALKGPSGIGMARLFETPPDPGDGSAILMIAVSSADLMVAKLISGEYDAGVLPVNVAAKLYNAGVPIRLAAIVGDGMVSFLCSDPAISGLADLRGRKVNVAGQDATPDFLFRRLLEDAGVDPRKDLRLDYSLSYPEAASALAAGKIACAILPEPFATMARATNPALRSPIDLGELWTRRTGQRSYPMTAFVVSSKLAAGRPRTVKAILAAYASSIAWIKERPAEAGALVEKEGLGLTASIASKAIPLSAYVFTEARAARSSVEALLGAFLDLAPVAVGGKLPDDGFYASF